MKTKSKIVLFDPIYLLPGESERIPLTKDGSCWLEVEQMAEELMNTPANFEQLFYLHPNKSERTEIYRQNKRSPRWHQTYLLAAPHDQELRHSFMLSGSSTEEPEEPVQSLPAVFQPLYDYLVSTDQRFNQVVASWYEDGEDFIPPHSFCQVGMVPDAVISLMTLTSAEKRDECRVFKIRPKATHIGEVRYEELHVVLRNGTLITMGGDTQQMFKHGVPRVMDKQKQASPRISLTFRQFAIDGQPRQSAASSWRCVFCDRNLELGEEINEDVVVAGEKRTPDAVDEENADLESISLYSHDGLHPYHQHSFT
jgi:alkylated DNA repair dioxygenase AlkB